MEFGMNGPKVKNLYISLWSNINAINVFTINQCALFKLVFIYRKLSRNYYSNKKKTL